MRPPNSQPPASEFWSNGAEVWTVIHDPGAAPAMFAGPSVTVARAHLAVVEDLAALSCDRAGRPAAERDAGALVGRHAERLLQEHHRAGFHGGQHDEHEHRHADGELGGGNSSAPRRSRGVREHILARRPGRENAGRKPYFAPSDGAASAAGGRRRGLSLGRVEGRDCAPCASCAATGAKTGVQVVKTAASGAVQGASPTAHSTSGALAVKWAFCPENC